MRGDDLHSARDGETAKVPLVGMPVRGWAAYASWIVGALALGGLIAAVLHIGDLDQFVRISHQLRLSWLLPAIAAQGLTYVVVALAWHTTLRRAGHRRPLAALIPLGIAKLFADQALPSGGLSGSIFVTFALRRRNVPAPTAIGILVIGMVSFNVAYVIAVVAGLMLLKLHHRSDPALLAVVAVFAFIAMAVPASLVWAKRWNRGFLARWILKFRASTILFQALTRAPLQLLKSPTLIAEISGCQLAIFILDALTLWFVFQAIAVPCPLWIAFVAFVIASAAATVSPVPLGLGAFEAAQVALLGLLDIPLEAALTATLVLRCLTFWLPMLPGLWLARREMVGKAQPQ